MFLIIKPFTFNMIGLGGVQRGTLVAHVQEIEMAGRCFGVRLSSGIDFCEPTKWVSSFNSGTLARLVLLAMWLTGGYQRCIHLEIIEERTAGQDRLDSMIWAAES
jgi:hypothetical protein